MNNFQESLRNLLQDALDKKVITHQQLVFAACQVARSVLYLTKTDKSLLAIEMTEKWCNDPTAANATAANAAAANVAAANANNAAHAAAAAGASVYAVANNIIATTAVVAAAAASAAAASAAAAADFDYSDHQQKMKSLLLSHLPRLNKTKIFF